MLILCHVPEYNFSLERSGKLETNWSCIDRTSQLKVEDCGISAGVYAPQIIYNPNNETFYMITTQFSGGFWEKYRCKNKRSFSRLE